MTTNIFTRAIRFANHNAPSVFTGLAIGGVLSAVATAIRATPKALIHIRQAEEGSTEDQRWKLVVKAVWKDYIPTALVLAGTITCVICANRAAAKRLSVVATALAASESAFTNYKDKAIGYLTKSESGKIDEEIQNDALNRAGTAPVALVATGSGDTLMFDMYSARYFYSDVEDVRAAVNRINSITLEDDWASINLFYDLIGLEEVKYGSEIGWTAGRQMELVMSSRLSPNNIPCVVIDYETNISYIHWKRYQ